MLFQWPLNLSLLEDKTSQKYIDSINQYAWNYRVIERVPGSSGPRRQWQEREGTWTVYTFFEEQFDSQFLRLWDQDRKVRIRIPTQGGLMQWSVTERSEDCGNQYCWGDVRDVRLRK
jgi:hypothetical protein